MKLSVVWDQEVEARFILLWTDSTSDVRTVLTRVANRVDSMLGTDADLKGQLQADTTRALGLNEDQFQVTVFYEVRVDDRLVRVLRLTFKCVD